MPDTVPDPVDDADPVRRLLRQAAREFFAAHPEHRHEDPVSTSNVFLHEAEAAYLVER